MRRPVLSSICHFGQAAAICLAKIRRNMLGMLRPYVRVRQECVGLDTLHVVAKIKLGLLTRGHTAEYFGNFCSGTGESGCCCSLFVPSYNFMTSSCCSLSCRMMTKRKTVYIQHHNQIARSKISIP